MGSTITPQEEEVLRSIQLDPGQATFQCLKSIRPTDPDIDAAICACLKDRTLTSASAASAALKAECAVSTAARKAVRGAFNLTQSGECGAPAASDLSTTPSSSAPVCLSQIADEDQVILRTDLITYAALRNSGARVERMPAGQYGCPRTAMRYDPVKKEYDIRSHPEIKEWGVEVANVGVVPDHIAQTLTPLQGAHLHRCMKVDDMDIEKHPDFMKYMPKEELLKTQEELKRCQESFFRGGENCYAGPPPPSCVPRRGPGAVAATAAPPRMGAAVAPGPGSRVPASAEAFRPSDVPMSGSAGSPAVPATSIASAAVQSFLQSALPKVRAISTFGLNFGGKKEGFVNPPAAAVADPASCEPFPCADDDLYCITRHRQATDFQNYVVQNHCKRLEDYTDLTAHPMVQSGMYLPKEQCFSREKIEAEIRAEWDKEKEVLRQELQRKVEQIQRLEQDREDLRRMIELLEKNPGISSQQMLDTLMRPATSDTAPAPSSAVCNAALKDLSTSTAVGAPSTQNMQNELAVRAGELQALRESVESLRRVVHRDEIMNAAATAATKVARAEMQKMAAKEAATEGFQNVPQKKKVPTAPHGSGVEPPRLRSLASSRSAVPYAPTQMREGFVAPVSKEKVKCALRSVRVDLETLRKDTCGAFVPQQLGVMPCSTVPAAPPPIPERKKPTPLPIPKKHTPLPIPEKHTPLPLPNKHTPLPIPKKHTPLPIPMKQNPAPVPSCCTVAEGDAVARERKKFILLLERYRRLLHLIMNEPTLSDDETQEDLDVIRKHIRVLKNHLQETEEGFANPPMARGANRNPDRLDAMSCGQ